MLKKSVIRFGAFVASAALTFGSFIALSVGAATPAAAAESTVPPVVDTPSDAVTADALPTAQINGVVWDQAVVGDIVYAGGQFTSARPAGAAAGTSESTRYNLMSYNVKTGVMTSWAPNVNGRIRVVTASPDGSRIYIGGSFTTVNGVTRSRIAAFNTSDGSLVTSFAPVANSDVFGIAATNTTVYLGGWLTAVNNTPRSRLAAVNASNGALTAWAPSASHTVYGLGLTNAQDRVVVAGSFDQLNGTAATSIGSVSAADGTSYPFAANTVVHNYGNTASLMSLKVIDDKAYTSGYWYGGTGNFEGGLIVNPYDGTILNMANCLGDTYDVTPMNGVMYMVSHHHQCTDIGGFPEEASRIWQHTDAVTIEATGQVQTNTYGYPNFAGNPSGSYLNWAPYMTTGSASGSSQAGWTIESSGDYLIVGGEFTAVNGTKQQGLVRFTTKANGAPAKMGPGATTSSITPNLRNLTSTTTRVRFQSDFDRDGTRELSYKVNRRVSGGTAQTTVHTGTGQSTWWDRPSFQFIDSGLTSGTTYQYQVTVTDSDGNSRISNWASITAGANVPDNSPYSQQVIADGASNYWRLNEASGATTSTDWADGNDLAVSAGVSMGAAGAIIGSSDTAATFSGGDTGRAVTSTPQVGPNTFSTELWFKTASTSGGKLMGFGNAATGNSGSYDRHLYMSNDGRLTFGVYNNATYTITSNAGLNDNQWHHVVASLSSSGMVLYVDGLKVGSNTGTTIGQPYTGYWRVGGDNIGGWSNTGSSSYFNGVIDDVAVYPTALTRDEIRDHFTKSGRTIDLPPLPSDSYGAAVVSDEPQLFWRFGESSGNTAADASGNGQTGTYYNGPTLGAASDVVPGNTAVGFDGSDDLVTSNQSVDNPTNFSAEAWFKTTTTRGGKILGFGSSQTGNSGSYDRHIYMNDSGQLRFGAWTGSSQIAGTSASYNDGKWHQVVATLGGNGMQLFVDGVLVATNPNTSAQAYSGYWRVGGDNSWEGSSGYFNGTVDEVAIYNDVLSAERVRAHYKASAAATNQQPTSAFSVTRSGLKATFTAAASDPDGTIAGYEWSFGDGGTSTQQNPSHTYAQAGSFQVQLKVTDDQGATATSTQTVVVREAAATPTDAYGKAVTQSGPQLYWRLDEATGTTALDTTANLNDGTYRGTYAQGAESSVAGGNKALGLSGAGGFVSANEQVNNPTTFSLEAWFNNTSGNGRIIGFGNQAEGFSNNYDRHIYLDNGNLVFGTYNNGTHTLSTSGTNYGDGNWHQVVATFGSAGMVLYVDGAQVAASGDNVAQDFSGYWRVGDDSYWGNGQNFVGTIDEAAVYDKVLTAQQVATHYAASTVGNAAPTADFTVTCNGAACTFTATANDPDGSIADYHWDFGDGVTGTGATATHTYATGDYTAILTVTDNRGATTTVSHPVSVVVQNQQPVAHIADPTIAGLKVTVDGSGSTDPDGTIASYAWNFGDGTTASTATAQHTYGAAGQYTVTLTVTDNEGASAQTTVTVNVAPVNQAPKAVIAEPTKEDLTVHLNGGGSSDADGTVVSYAWDFGDGNTGTGALVDHTYAAAGTYTVKLTVTDDKGATDQAQISVKVTAANQAPVPSFTATPTDLTVALDASASSDPDGTIASYAWNYGDGNNGTGRTASHTYASAGTYTVTLTVTDDQGKTAQLQKSVSVTAPPVADVIAKDTFGRTTSSGWGTAETGGAWSVTGTAANFGVDGSQGQVTLASGGATRTTWLNSVSARDVTYTGEFDLSKAPAGATYIQQVFTRVSGSTTYYSFTVRLEAGGIMRMNLAKVVSGTETTLKSATVSGFNYTANEKLKFRFDTNGAQTATLAAKVWRASAAEPSSAMIDATDSTAALQGNGGLGLRFYAGGSMSNLPIVVSVDNLLATAYSTEPVPNAKPTASFTTSANALKVSVDGSGSSDTDGTIASYAWEYGDGGTGTGKTDSHTYTAAGTYTVKLTVTDDDGATDSTTKSVTVTAPAPNVKPTAAFTATTSSLKVSVDGAGSSDTDGTIASYAWEYGDGGTGTRKTDSHTYTAAGTYTVKLTVTDDDGATDSTTKSVTVTAPASNVVAEDAFARTTASGWGSADTGGSWTVNTASAFSTDGANGVVSVAAGATRQATLASVSQRDVSVLTDFTLDKAIAGGSYYHQVLTRVDGTNWYSLTARLETTGILRVYIAKTVSGTETVLKTTTLNGFDYAAGEKLKVRFDVAGNGTTTLAGTVWRSGDTEPGSPTVTITDSTAALQSAGALRLKFYAGSTMTSVPLGVKVGDFEAEVK